MNYKDEIKKMLGKIPFKVTNGSVNQAIGYKIAAEKAMAISGKSRATELELIRAYEDLKAYE